MRECNVELVTMGEIFKVRDCAFCRTHRVLYEWGEGGAMKPPLECPVGVEKKATEARAQAHLDSNSEVVELTKRNAELETALRVMRGIEADGSLFRYSPCPRCNKLTGHERLEHSLEWVCCVCRSVDIPVV